MVIKKEIVYPMFLECCQFTQDTFWENTFEDLAYGKTPYGTYISKSTARNQDFLCCGFKGKEFSYKIEQKDPKELYTDVYELLSERVGIQSEREKKKKKICFQELEKSIMENRQEWGNIRKKNVKDTMYEKYVVDMKNKHSLSNTQAKFLLSNILLSIMFKSITSKDIEYNDDRIENIDGIEFKKGKVILKRPIYSISSCNDEEPISCDEKKRMSDQWEKFLKTLRKQSTKIP